MTSSESTTDMNDTGQCLASAEKLRTEGRLGEAAAGFESVLEHDPDNLAAIVSLAQIAVAERQMDRCLELLDKAIGLQPETAELRFRRGTVLHQLGHVDDARSAYEETIERDPRHVPALLKLGACCLALGDRDNAVATYQRVVGITGPVGRALQDERLPDAIRADVRLMHQTLMGTYRELVAQTLTYLRARYPAKALYRIEAALRTVVGKQEKTYDHPQQRPGFFFIPGLRPIPWFEREQFEWVARVEAAFPVVRRELEAILPERAGFKPYIHGTQGQKATTPDGTDFSHLAGSPTWSAYHLHKSGRIDEHCDRCPETAGLMDSLPLAEAEGWMPETFFSVLAPGEKIIPHYGQMNGRLTVHLALIIPPGCGIRVCGEQREWQEGKVLAFDDSFLHEAWNGGETDRSVFIFEVWHPDMTEAEIDGVQHFLNTRTRWLEGIEGTDKPAGKSEAS